MKHPILGLHHVTATVDDAQSDLDFYLDGLGLRLVKKTVNFDNHNVYHFYYGDERGRNGLGTVHHVAMAISSPDEQLRLRHELLDMGYGVTPVLDRQYFQSIYFREPGGVLLEVATIQPGFTVDEALPDLRT